MIASKLLSLGVAVLVGAGAASAQQLRYMPFGDSITEIVCWRAKLWQRLRTTEWGGGAVDWVGSGRGENNCGDTEYDRDNEGHSGFLAINIANQRQLVGWLQRNPADVITMHLGTNDITQNRAVNDIIAAFTTLVGDMRASNPRMKIIVAQIIPISFGNLNGPIQNLNRAIVPWAQGLNTTESPIWVVDQYTGFNTGSDLRDGVHPSNSGDEKMANVWYPAIVRAFEMAKADRLAQLAAPDIPSAA
ncbi:hypothetical protein DL764_003333 [Monosporascus ibericus]|uniref:SGNH hydrolase-type esterase domain-containing protein n=1 Tax=Monosporascus ibericus TaxID=155417 RepID=A0A4Q4TGV4_9PEZI|nr:hypothetical protein DL764_003333 [Monosporascus ibericus]